MLQISFRDRSLLIRPERVPGSREFFNIDTRIRSLFILSKDLSSPVLVSQGMGNQNRGFPYEANDFYIDFGIREQFPAFSVGGRNEEEEKRASLWMPFSILQ